MKTEPEVWPPDFEPRREPDMAIWLAKRHEIEYGPPTDEIDRTSGWLLPDGRAVPLGSYGVRAEDHRGSIPTRDAMRRWGWPQEVIAAADVCSRWPALLELMIRSRSVRLGVMANLLSVNFYGVLSTRQKRAILDYLRSHPECAVVFDREDGVVGRNQEFGAGELCFVEEWLDRN